MDRLAARPISDLVAFFSFSFLRLLPSYVVRSTEYLDGYFLPCGFKLSFGLNYSLGLYLLPLYGVDVVNADRRLFVPRPTLQKTRTLSGRLLFSASVFCPEKRLRLHAGHSLG
jgi:hypothetical protein